MDQLAFRSAVEMKLEMDLPLVRLYPLVVAGFSCRRCRSELESRFGAECMLVSAELYALKSQRMVCGDDSRVLQHRRRYGYTEQA